MLSLGQLIRKVSAMPRKYICTVIIPDDYIETSVEEDIHALENNEGMSFDDLIGNALWDDSIVVRYVVMDVEDIPEKR